MDIYDMVILFCCVFMILDMAFTKYICMVLRTRNVQCHQKRKMNRECSMEQTDDKARKIILLNFIKEYIFSFVDYKLRILGHVPSHRIRNWILRHVYCMKIGKNAVIYGGFEIRAPWNIEIGAGSVIGDESKLDGRNGIFIGENVNISTGVWIWTEEHKIDDPEFVDKGGPVRIGDRAWISSRVTVPPNLVVGEGPVVVAGAVLTKDAEAYGVYGGIPAKKLRTRERNLTYVFDGKHRHFY